MNIMKNILNEFNLSSHNLFNGTDKDTVHNYIDGFYEKEFIKYKDKNIKILEIGIFGGHSLLLWNKYFTNHEGIYGIDISSEPIIKEVKEHDKINIIIDDGYAKNIVDKLPSFDIIIDDGPHTLESMISCINLYLPKLNSGGIIVIEDVQYPYWINTLHEVFEKVKTQNDTCEVIDLRYTKGRYDDLMFIIRRS